ncbi:MAG: hypothetical protein CVU59_05560 [Deltaproteobacteria bacterium HGW-Deltaproteobacteria-17]|nr:MAG: hypothetical protein CVU59_05560 [Deltaproteobacteria bacterium HGW-Deltaproteobacteria-17]
MKPEFHASRTFDYGPLPPRWWMLAVGIVALLLTGLFGLTMVHRRAFLCVRAEPGGGTCRIVSETPWTATVENSIDVSAVREVRWRDTSSPKGGKKGETVLILASGHEIRVATGPQPASRAAYERIQSFFNNPGQATLAERVAPTPWLWLGALAMLVAGLALLFVFARTVTSFRIELEDGGGRLRIRASRHGVPGRWRELETGGLRGLVVETSSFIPWHAKSSSTPIPTARLLLKLPGNRTVPLTPGFHENPAATVGLKDELGSALGLWHEPDVPTVESSRTPDDGPLPADPYADVDAQLAVASQPERFSWKVHGKRMLLLGGVLVVGSLAFLLVSTYLTGETGRLTVRCEHRCRFGATECLPGGGWSSPLKPGAYTLEVWNPAVPGNWQSILVEVRDGETTHFICRPR